MDPTAITAGPFEAVRTHAPHVLLGAGVLLLLVPRWLRVSIAVAMIAFGLVGIWPELLDGGKPVAE